VLSCDGLGCVYRIRGNIVALAQDVAALAEDCRRSDIVISAVSVRGRCPAARIVIDRFDLWRAGAHAVWLGGKGKETRVVSVADARGQRPWTPARPARVTPARVTSARVTSARVTSARLAR